MMEILKLTAALELVFLKKTVKEFLQERGYDPLFFNLEAMISPPQFLYGIIRQEHDEMKQKNEKEIVISSHLSNKYGYKADTIRKIISGNR